MEDKNPELVGTIYKTHHETKEKVVSHTFSRMYLSFYSGLLAHYIKTSKFKGSRVKTRPRSYAFVGFLALIIASGAIMAIPKDQEHAYQASRCTLALQECDVALRCELIDLENKVFKVNSVLKGEYLEEQVQVHDTKFSFDNQQYFILYFNLTEQNTIDTTDLIYSCYYHV